MFSIIVGGRRRTAVSRSLLSRACHDAGTGAIRNCHEPLRLRILAAFQEHVRAAAIRCRQLFFGYLMRALTVLGHQRKLATAAALVGALLPASALAGSDGGSAFLEKLSLNPMPSRMVVVCHGFGCTYRDELVLTPARLAYLHGLLAATHSAKDERRALAVAVAWFDREGGRAAGTVGRIARAGTGTESGPSQMDCIDLTANITELLIALERNKLLKYHRVDEPVSRGLFVDGRQPHTTPVIVEIASGMQWSVDSWTKAYGQSPDILTISEWKSRK
jgi:hypothetical protein